MNPQAPALNPTVAEQLAAFAAATREQSLPRPVHQTVALLLKDVIGLCVAARHSDYVKAALASAIGQGHCTAIGHTVTVSPSNVSS